MESIIAPFARRHLQKKFARRLYRQRWKAETGISVVKRKFRDTLAARTDQRQYRQLLLLGVVCNVHRRVVVLLIVRIDVSDRRPRRGFQQSK